MQTRTCHEGQCEVENTQERVRGLQVETRGTRAVSRGWRAHASQQCRAMQTSRREIERMSCNDDAGIGIWGWKGGMDWGARLGALGPKLSTV